MKLKLPLLFLIILISQVELLATHNRAGEITYIQIGPQTIEITITTYTKTSSTNADRNELEVMWGDGTSDILERINGPLVGGIPNGEPLANDTKVNIYKGTHTYPSLGHFVISMNDKNRNGQICNVNGASPDNVSFHLQTTVTLFNQTFEAPNNSPILLQAPIDIGCVGQPFQHNPNAYDIDGDSLAYRLIVPLQAPNSPVPLYKFPDEIQPGPDNNITFNEKTGDFFWFSPQQECEYNIALYIIEYRDGNPIDTLIRDLQILIETCDNLPPVIETEEEICVVAGELIEFEVTATAPAMESDQLVNLTATGGPFELDFSPATFDEARFYQGQPLTRTFRWQTQCEHIEDQFYTVIFRSADNFPVTIDQSSGDTSFLSTLKIVRIKVVGPAPEEVAAIPDNGQVEITWKNPYVCEDAANEYFRGFTVWRRINSNNFPIDTCVTGLAGQGYTKITPQTVQESDGDRYVYLDFEVERGLTYCYRILAEFSRLTPSGFEFNRIESLPSDEVCVQLNRDIPLLTNVSVQSTDTNNGTIEVIWSTPDADDLDTLINPGPYVYELWRATGNTSTGFELVPGATFTAQNFFQAVDTTFLDTGLNTSDNAYTYRLGFYVNNEPEPIDFSPTASSVYLEVASTDNTNILSWNEATPWNNFLYRIFRFENNDFTLIDSTNQRSYSDTGLLNGREYCYRIESEGSYNITRVKSPLFNLSQENCGTPLDTVPPCPPILVVGNLCDEVEEDFPEEDFINELIWQNPNFICPETDDVVGYRVYFSEREGGDLALIYSTELSTDTTFSHKPDFGIAGCYGVTAVDTFNNESAFSDIVCVDNCPQYNLPNVFTPNGDGANERFIPYPYRFVESVDFQVFNKWGNLVFETNDPDLNWDGKNLNGKDLNEGVYYYSCRVFESRVVGVRQNPDILKGWIELIR